MTKKAGETKRSSILCFISPSSIAFPSISAGSCIGSRTARNGIKSSEMGCQQCRWQRNPLLHQVGRHQAIFRKRHIQGDGPSVAAMPPRDPRAPG